MKSQERTKWFEHDRFGAFIHFGLYSILAREGDAWARSREQICAENYQQYFDRFNPVDFDAKAWAKLLSEAGMKYAVFTTKHHDGFCLFDSAYTDYKVTNTPFRRDIVKEYVEAFRAEGLKIGFYYSLLDWHHPDYPHYGDAFHPDRNNESFKGVEHKFENYVTYFHNQVKELCTNYGTVDIFWFDFSYDDMTGEKWGAADLVRMVRSYQPNVLIDNRLDLKAQEFGKISASPKEYWGDFASPEQIIPPNGVTDAAGEHVVWEACFTMNKSWGYSRNDSHYKSAAMCIRKLVECVSKGGNLLLNVGPDALGNIPQPSVDILKEMGTWLKKNGSSIYGASRSAIEKPEYGRVTGNGDKLYFHIFDSPIGPIPLFGLKRDQIKYVRMLADGTDVPFAVQWYADHFPDLVLISPDEGFLLPDLVDTVIEVTIK